MKTIELDEPLVGFKKAAQAMDTPIEFDHLQKVDEETVVCIAGVPVAHYKPDVFNPANYLEVFQKLAKPATQKVAVNRGRNSRGLPSSSQRLSGIQVPSTTYGFTNAAEVRRRYCASPSAANQQQPVVWKTMQHLLGELSNVWEDSLYPFGDYQEDIYSCWKIGHSPFTSCIHNFSLAAYPYHRDSNNVPGSWSLMPVVRSVEGSGGYLVIPEMGCYLACESGSVASFQGGKWWHGVSDIVGERWSVVYYSKKRLAEAAGSLEEEIAAGNARRTEYEKI